MDRNLLQVAREARKKTLVMTNSAKAAHVGSSLSVIDIATVLFNKTLNQNHKEDLVLISKGHAAAGIYAVLNQFKVIPDLWIQDYCKNGAMLGGHVTSINVPILELSTGSLGHALPYGVGRAIGKRRKGELGQVYVVLSDGECDEGSNWEAALLAAHLKLSNLTVILDRNRIQSLGDTETTVALEPLAKKWEAFNWGVSEVDGHNLADLEEAIFSNKSEAPRMIIANTVKGKGVEFMENSIKWHYRPPNDHELKDALDILQ